MHVYIPLTAPSSFIFWQLPDELFGLVYSFLDICTIVQHEILCRSWHDRLKSVPVSNAIWFQICSRLLEHQRLNANIGDKIDWKSAFQFLTRFEASDWSRYSAEDILHHGDNELWRPTDRSRVLSCQRYPQSQPPHTEFYAFRFGQHIVFNHIRMQAEMNEISVVDVITRRTCGPFQVTDLLISGIAAIGTNFEECTFIPLIRTYVSEDYILNQIGFFCIQALIETGGCQQEFLPNHIINLVNQQNLEAYAYNRILVSSTAELDVWYLPFSGGKASKILTLDWERSDQSRFALTKNYVIACCPWRNHSDAEDTMMVNIFSIHSSQLVNILEMRMSTPHFTNDIIFMQNQPPTSLIDGSSTGIKFDPAWIDTTNLQVTLDGSLMVLHEASSANNLFEMTKVVDIYAGLVTSHKVGQYDSLGALVIYRPTKFTAAKAVFLPYTSNLAAANVASNRSPCLVLEKVDDNLKRLKLKIMVGLLFLLVLICILWLLLDMYEHNHKRFQSPAYNLNSINFAAFPIQPGHSTAGLTKLIIRYD